MNLNYSNSRILPLLFSFLLAVIGGIYPINGQSKFGHLNIHVMDSLGKPVSGCLISMYKDQVLAVSDTSDSDGFISFYTLEPGDYKIRFHKVPFPDSEYERQLTMGYNPHLEVILFRYYNPRPVNSPQDRNQKSKRKK